MDNISKREENFEKLTMADNFLFGEVMYDEKTGKDVLEIILGVNIERVVVVDKEKHIDNVPDRKSIRLDVYMKDKKNTVYNIEMQVEDKKDIPHRSRYYQGLMDVKQLPAGTKDYRRLNDTYIIFICQFDPFGKERCCYTFEQYCVEETALQLNDGTKKIFLNTKGKNREETDPILVEFLDYIREPLETDIHDARIMEIDNRIKKIKQDMKVRERYMTLMHWIEDEAEKMAEKMVEKKVEKAVEKATEEAKELGLKEGMIKIIRKKKEKLFSINEVAELLEQEEEEIKVIYALLDEYPDADDNEIARIYQTRVDSCF